MIINKFSRTMWIFPEEPEQVDEENTNYHSLLDTKKEKLSVAPDTSPLQ